MEPPLNLPLLITIIIINNYKSREINNNLTSKSKNETRQSAGIRPAASQIIITLYHGEVYITCIPSAW